MNTFRMGLVMMTVAVGSMLASEGGSQKNGKQAEGITQRIQNGLYSGNQHVVNGSQFVVDHTNTVAAHLFAEAMCDEDEDFKKALIESLGLAADTDSKGAAKSFSVNLPANYGIRKGTRYLNGKGITLETVASKCDIVPKDWALTREV